MSRRYIPASQLRGLFHVPVQRLHERIAHRCKEAHRELTDFEEKHRNRLRPKVLEQELGKLRDKHIGVAREVYRQIEEHWDNVRAQLDHPYREDVLRYRQADDLPPERSQALRAELRGAATKLLLRRAERAEAEGDVATATLVEEEVERRADQGSPLSDHARGEILKLTSSTTNAALQQDMEARDVLVRVSHMAEHSRLVLRELTGEITPLDRIRYGVRVAQELGEAPGDPTGVPAAE